MDQVKPTGNCLYFNQDMVEPQTMPFAGGFVSVFSARCPDKPTPNEDAAGIVLFHETAAALVIADGLGGTPEGEKAARLATEAIEAAIAQAQGKETMLRAAILNGIENANTTVRRLGSGGATTLAVVEISDETIRPYHVGDSEILVTGSRGKIKLQIVAHSPVAYGVEAGLIDESQALHHEDRHIVSNVIGTEDMRIDIGPPRKLALKDTVILASDGVFDNLYVSEIVEYIRKGSLANAAATLRNALMQRMIGSNGDHPTKPDDVTFILFRRSA